MKNFASFLISLFISFNLLSQSIVGVSPNSAAQGQMLTVSLSGQNTHFNQGTATQVWFSQGSYTIMGTNTTIVNNTNLTTQINVDWNAPTGFYNTNANNSLDGSMVKPNSFSVFSQSINNAPSYPNKSKPGKTIDVYVPEIIGINFYNAQFQYQKGNLVIPIAQNTQVLSFGMYGNTSFPVNADTGYYNLVITNSTGFYSFSNALKLVSQNEATIDSMVVQDTLMYDTLDIYGHNTHFTDTSLHISLATSMWNIMVFSITVINDEHIKIAGVFVNYVKYPDPMASWMVLYNNIDDTLTYPFISFVAGSIGEDKTSFKNLDYFPNPTSDKVRIHSEEFTGNDVSLEVFTSDGKGLFGREFKAGQEVEIDLRNYPAGFYNIRVKSGDKSKTITVIKR